MPGTCVIGLQWGDEAKGKLVDLLTSQFDLVVRYQGGANAGHTVVVGDQVYKLHHIPSGILNPDVMNLVTPGVVLHPESMLTEIDGLAARGIDVEKNLIISERVHLVCPWHLAEDRLLNAAVTSGESIGTTLRGIGPCYRDKVGRHYALRMGDLYRKDFPEKLASIVEFKNGFLAGLDPSSNEGPLDLAKLSADFERFAGRLKPFVRDTTHFLLESLEKGKNVLFEGAQGSLLDIDHGTFPFVTSSNASGVGVCPGAGVPPRWIKRTLGVAKCYSTRVGGGPFPTELHDATGQLIRDTGREYGTTTGRPRRCGWFDAVAVRYTSRLSGVDFLCMMMLDVLSALDEIKICTHYLLDGERVDNFPCHVEDLRNAQPVYDTLPGWRTDVTGVKRLSDLPGNARRYLDRVAELVGRPIGVVSVGPERSQTMFSADF